MTSIAHSSVIIQTTSEAVPSTPDWLGEVVLLVQHLRKLGVLEAITSQVRFARRRFGHYEVIDFLADVLARHLDIERHTGTLVDRAGNARVVFDIDGTRQAARQRALPKAEELPPPQRRLHKVCAPGYTGRKRGEVVRTRTVV